MAGVRFGNTRDVVVLFNGDDEEVSEYIRGLIFIATITLIMFMVRMSICNFTKPQEKMALFDTAHPVACVPIHYGF